MSKIFADVREYQNRAHAAGFYRTTNLVLHYLHVEIFANRYFDRRRDCKGVQAYAVRAGEGKSLLLPLLSEGTRLGEG